MIITSETYEDGVLVSTEQIEVPDPLPEPLPDADTLIASIAEMTPAQKSDLRAALGL